MAMRTTQTQRKINLVAMSLVMRSGTDELISDSVDVNDAAEARQIRENACHQNTEFGEMLKLRGLAGDNGEKPILEYTNEMVKIKRVLQHNIVDMTEKQLAQLCLPGLPPEYEMT